VVLYLKVTNAPANSVDNIRFWSAGKEIGSGATMYVGSTSVPSTPTTNQSTIADTDAITYTDSDNSLLWSDASLVDIDDTSEYLYMQIGVDSSASIGDLNNQYMVYHYSYDES